MGLLYYILIFIMVMLLTGKRFASTISTPEVILDPNGLIIIKGRSLHKNASEFYKQIESWLDEYFNNPAERTIIEISLEYFNGANSMILNSLLRKISDIKLGNKEVVINWYYEEDDEDVLATGENISSILSIPVNLIIINESTEK